MRADGATLYWSSAGAEQARNVAECIGVADLFVAFLPKPTLLIDDRELVAPRIHPNELIGRSAPSDTGDDGSGR